VSWFGTLIAPSTTQQPRRLSIRSHYPLYDVVKRASVSKLTSLSHLASDLWQAVGDIPQNKWGFHQQNLGVKHQTWALTQTRCCILRIQESTRTPMTAAFVVHLALIQKGCCARRPNNRDNRWQKTTECRQRSSSLVRSEHEPHEAVRVPHSQGRPGFHCSGPDAGYKPRYTLVIKVVNPGVLGYICA